MMIDYFIYIMASKRNSTLYTGVTNDLLRRVDEHKHDNVKGFTKIYGVHKLVYFEQCDDFDAALQREKQIKERKGEWKLEIFEKENPLWQDLFDETLKNS